MALTFKGPDLTCSLMITLADTCCSKLMLCWNGPNTFCTEEFYSLPQGLAGVYVLSAFTPLRPLLVPFYAGQSGHLSRRLGEHLNGTRSFAKHFQSMSTYFHLASVSDPNLRDSVEATLIRNLKPAGNTSIPRADSVQINFPSFSLLDPTEKESIYVR